MEYCIYKGDDELIHWGVKGMRWGVRRYQNKDGSLTKAGERRYKKELAAIRKEEAVLKNRKATAAKLARLDARKQKVAEGNKALDGDESQTKKLSKKDAKKAAAEQGAQTKKTAKNMTDEELISAINRARLEDTYNQLRPTAEKRPMMKRLVDEVLVPSAINSGKKFLESAMNKATEKLLNGKADPNSLEALKKTYDKLDYKNKIDKILNPDKHLSEEDKNKRQQRAFDLEDRNAKMEGYQNAADKAAKQREASEAARKATADAAARVANEPKSREYYESVYRNKGTGKESAGSNKSGSNELVVSNSPITSLSKTTTSSGKSVVDKVLNDNYYEVLDRNGNVLVSYR